ncbi:translocation/assembly module TamB domain-containing protein [Flavicella sediminum]|uniref:translocation/assembly module TamB domain-containing protein n=1 Tax=Flavicella sediminum TaxID=2585141 RepID=UPI00140C4162|nr:translocation/assembly module TamB domain-containing protein [Flavicella sediminum]
MTNTLQNKFDVYISVGQMDLSYLGFIKLKDILIRDHHDNTLIAVDKLETSLLSFKEILEKKVDLGKVSLADGEFYLTTYKGEEQSNLTIFSSKLAKKSKNKDDLFLLNALQIAVDGIDFEIRNKNREKGDLIAYYKNIKGQVFDFELKGTDISAKLRELSLEENHNLKITAFKTDFVYTLSRMDFKNTSLKTEHSKINAEIIFHYEGDDLKYFNDKVQIHADLKESYISTIDLKKLYKEFNGVETFYIKTGFSGTVNNFKLAHLDLFSKNNLVLNGSYHIKNSALADATFSLKGVTNKFSSNYDMLKDLFPRLVGTNMPSEFKKIGDFSMEGASLITSDTIDLDVSIVSSIGEVTTKLLLTEVSKIDEASFNGHIKVTDFDLGLVVNDSLLGEISLEGDIKGKGFTVANLNAKIKGDVTKHQYKGYTYKNIKINGFFKNKHFNGRLKVNDKNLKLDFLGLADFSKAENNFNFKAKVDYAKFNQLHLFTKDSIAILKGDIEMKFKGNKLDDIQGEAHFVNSSYTNQNKKFEFKDFNIISAIKDSVKIIRIDSKDIVNGQIRGVFKLSEIQKLTQNAMGSMLSNYVPFPVDKHQFFEFDFKIYNEIVEVFLPQIKFGTNTILKGKVIDDNNEIKLLFQTPKLSVYKTILDQVDLQIDNKNPVLNTNLTIKKVATSDYILNEVNLLNKTLNDTLFFRTDFTAGKEGNERFDLSLFYTYNKDQKSVLGVKQAKVRYKNEDWFVNPDENAKNKVIFDIEKEEFNFEQFDLASRNQKIHFSGVIKDSTYKDLKVHFDKVSLNDVTPKIDSLSLKGIVNGKLNFKQEAGIYKPFGVLNIDDFKINNAEQGDLSMHLNAEDSYKKYNVNIELISDSYKNLEATGTIDLTPKQPIIDLAVKLDAFKLNAFSPLGKNILTKIRGFADGQFKVTGALSNPVMDGELSLSKTGLSIPYLNVDYNFVGKPKITLEKQSFVFNNLELQDSKLKTQGFLNGNIHHSAFKDWMLDLRISSNRLLVLDTKDDENVSYYGTGFISGTADFIGPTNDLRINVKAKTLAGTKFIIPLSDVKAIENSTLIHFKEVKKKKGKELLFDGSSILKNIQGLSLNFDIDVTKEALGEVVIDRVSGSSLKGYGSGNITIEIDTKGKFNMFGDYLVDSGIYNFIYGGVINKPFIVKKGGVVSWDGDPYNAELNIEAIHQVKANPKALLESLSTNRKIDIDLVTQIRGKLFNSSNEFDIVIPNSSSVVASELDFKLNDNDDNTKMRQFFSLLISKSFYNENNLAENGNSAITGTTSDIISGALSDIFNKSGDRLQIDLGYTAGEKNDLETQNIDDQVDISLATQINDRVLINGKLGVPVGTKTQSSVVGEVKVEVLVDEEGNLRWTFFNRQNEIQYSEEEEGYTQGIGLTYQIDFDNISEVFEKFRSKRKRKKEKELKTEEVPIILTAPF